MYSFGRKEKANYLPIWVHLTNKDTRVVCGEQEFRFGVRKEYYLS